MAGLHFPITADNGSFMRALNEVTAGVRDASRQIEAEGGSIDRVISSIKGGLATLGVGLGLKELSGQIFNTRAQFEQLEIAFTTMLGSAEKADALLTQLKQTAAKTPFEMEDVVGGAKSLLAYGIEAEKVNDTLVRLGDIASGLGIQLNDLTYLYGTTMVQGRMFTQDLRQFQGRGVPIADELAKVLGIAKDKVGEAVTAGKVGAKELEQAIIGLTNEGSKFGGLMAKQSDSLKGKWENIKDTIGLMFNEMGQQTSGVMNLTLDATASIVDHWQEVIAVLGSVAAAYGAQKGILMLDSAFTAAKNDFGYNSEMAQLQALIPVKEEAAKTDLEQAVASGNLTKAKADQIAALREEANAQLDALAKKEAAAKAEEAAALAKEAAAKKNVAAIDEEITALAEKLQASMDSMSAEELESSVIELNTLETLKNEGADAAQAAAEEVKAAATNVATASEARETLATQINTAQTAGNTAATKLLTIAKEKYALVVAKVNAVMAANKYAIIIGAVIALGYAIYKLITYQSEEEKRAEAVSKAHAKCMVEYAKEKKELNSLANTLASAKKGSDEWKGAKDSIVSQYGQYFKNLDAEIEKVGNLSTSYSILTREIKKSIVAKQLKEYDEDHEVDTASTLKNSLELISTGYMVYNPETGKNEKRVASKELQLQWQDQLSSYLLSDEEVELDPRLVGALRNAKSTWYGGHHSVWDEVEGNKKDLKANNADKEKIANSMGLTLEEVFKQETYDNTKPETKDKSYWENKKKDATSRLEALSDIAAKGKEGDKIRQEIAEYDNRLKPFEDGSKSKSGSTPEQIASKQSEAHQKLIDLMKQQAEERLKQEQDYEYERWQNRIDLMQEGEAKVIAQMELDQSKERTSLEGQKQQAIQAEIERQKAVFDAKEDAKAAGNKKYAKKVFNPETDVDQAQIKVITDRYDALNADLLAKQKKAEQDRLQSAQESFNSYLQEFGNYQQKREAIEADYNSRIEAAANTGDRMMLEAQKNKALSDLDYQQWIDSGEIALAFKDIERYSSNTVRKLIADMEKYRSKIIATFDPDKIEKYEEALRRLRKLDADQSFGIFSNFVPDYFKEKAAAAKELKDAEDNMNTIYEERSRLMNELLSLQKDIVDEVKKQTGTDISMSDALDIDKLKSIIEQINALGGDSSKLQGMTNKLPQLQNGIQQSGEAAQVAQQSFMGLSEAFAGSFSGGADAIAWIDTIVHGINDLVQGINNTFKELSSTAEVLGADMSEGSNWSQAGIIMQGFADASQGATDAWNSLKSGNIMGVVQGVVKSFTSWIKAFAAFSDAKHEKRIEELQDRIDILKDSYEDLQDAADKAYSSDASNLIEKQNENLRQQNALIRQQKAEEEAKKKTDKDKLKEYDDTIRENNKKIQENEEKAKEAIIGEDIKSALKEFASAYAEAWDDGTDAAKKSMQAVKSLITSALTELLKKNIQPYADKFYNTLADKMKKGYLTEADLQELDALKAQIDAMAASSEEQYKKIQERYKDLDELREELTDISFDSVRDNFKSLLSDMESSTEDFTNSFTDMLRNALIEGLMDNKYDALLKEWYAEFAKAMENQQLSDEEREGLRQQYDAIVQQGIADRNAINSIVGGGTYSQQASEGEAWGMSQETGDELNGRFTAMVELEATNNLLVSDGNAIARQILATLQSLSGLSMTVTGNGDNETLLAIKDMIFLQTGYLENIEKYSKFLATMSSDLSEVKSAVKDL